MLITASTNVNAWTLIMKCYPTYIWCVNIVLAVLLKNLTHRLILPIFSRTQRALLDPQKLPQMVINEPKYVENLPFRVLVKLLTIINSCECWFTQLGMISYCSSGQEDHKWSSYLGFLFFLPLQLLCLCSTTTHPSDSHYTTAPILQIYEVKGGAKETAEKGQVNAKPRWGNSCCSDSNGTPRHPTQVLLKTSACWHFMLTWWRLKLL